MIFSYGVILTLLSIGLTLYNPGFLSVLENKIYDTMHASIEYDSPPLPLIVDIDEKSLARLGQWPWSRYQMAKLFKKISDAGPASIGVDILFPEPDRTSLNQVKQELSSELGMRLNLDNIPYHLRDNDVYLSHTLIGGPFILGYKFFFSGTPNIPKAPVPLDLIFLKPFGSKKIQPNLYMAKGTIESLPVFSKVMDGAGFLFITFTKSQATLIKESKTSIYFSVAIAIKV